MLGERNILLEKKEEYFKEEKPVNNYITFIHKLQNNRIEKPEHITKYLKKLNKNINRKMKTKITKK